MNKIYFSWSIILQIWIQVHIFTALCSILMKLEVKQTMTTLVNEWFERSYLNKNIFLDLNIFPCCVIITRNKHVFSCVYFPNALCIRWITLNNYFSLFGSACNVRIKFESHMELGNVIYRLSSSFLLGKVIKFFLILSSIKNVL